jgi:glutamate formiminotransferase
MLYLRTRVILAKSLRGDNPRRCYTLPRVPQLECVPNVSEGRRPEVVARLLSALASVPGVLVLDASSDPDHNRSVLTLAGEPEALHAGLLALYTAALEEIDLTRHRGVHPRVGAVDVTPFVPLAGASMPLAVAAAERLGAALAEHFGLPVYLYERAARRPERRLLADIRRGGFEGFGAKIASPAWAPDFGPARVHPTAGVTVVGARDFLIALNAVLATGDVGIARAVARRVRESGGGLPALRAIGVPLPSRSLAQVSMNLVDYRRTSIWTALRAVAREAAALGAQVLETELIGLVPEEAALAALRESLAMPGFGRGRVLERRLEEESAPEARERSAGQAAGGPAAAPPSEPTPAA